MFFYIIFECFVHLSYIQHEIFEDLMRCASLLWIHHIYQIFIFFKLINKIFPMCFVRNASIQKFLLQHVSKVYPVISFTQSFLFKRLLFMPFLSFHNIIYKSANPIIWMQIFITLCVFIFSSKIIPSHIILDAVLLHQ